MCILTFWVLFYATSLEEAYEALRAFEILGIQGKPDISTSSCQSVSETLGSSSSTTNGLFHALKVNRILKCEIDEEIFQVSCGPCSVVSFAACKSLLLRNVAISLLLLNFNFLLKGITSRLKAVVNDGNSLLDYYYSIGSLVLIKVTINLVMQDVFSSFDVLRKNFY